MSTKTNPSTRREAVASYLEDEIHGNHGESERRVVGEFIRDAMEGQNTGPNPAAYAADLADYLAVVVRQTAKDLREMAKPKGKKK